MHHVDQINVGLGGIFLFMLFCFFARFELFPPHASCIVSPPIRATPARLARTACPVTPISTSPLANAAVGARANIALHCGETRAARASRPSAPLPRRSRLIAFFVQQSIRETFSSPPWNATGTKTYITMLGRGRPAFSMDVPCLNSNPVAPRSTSWLRLF